MTLAAVAGLHAAALLWLLAETRTQRIRSGPESAPILNVLLRTFEPRPAAGEMERRPARSRRTRGAARPEFRPQPSTAITSPPSISTDWAAEASWAAERLVESNEKSRRQANALAPAPSAMFAPPPATQREFPWQLNQVEIVEGVATVIHRGDRCGLVLFLIVPVAGGCTLDKMPARGDLFDHMHDHDGR